MATLLSTFDLIVLVLLVVHVIRTVRREALGSGSQLLSIFVALVVVTFAIVSLGELVGLARESSTFTQIVFLLILLGMSALIGFSWSDKPSRSE
jgi:hypothetical protein